MSKLNCLVLVLALGPLSGMARAADRPSTVEQRKLLLEQRRLAYSRLTPDEHRMLADGEVGTGSYIAGGVIGTVLGLGIGQAVQGRYLPNGAIVTAGELIGLTVALVGAGDCVNDTVNSAFAGNTTPASCNNGLIAAGLIGFVGFRIYELIDLWAGPPRENRRYRELRRRIYGTAEEDQPLRDRIRFGVLSASSKSASVGLQLRF